ncbi:unnamed protein product [Orchesella dallaii]|uniref:F-box domain-containing protein n=1 Tax=Orchesella dallaii TaxID=48710 RepID=A0ABP1S334_9HEXA
MKQYTVPLVKSGETNVEYGTQKELQSGEKLAQQTTEDFPLDKKSDLGDATTLTSKESGDGSLVVAAVNKHNSMLQSNQAQSVTAWQEAYSENISVTIIPDGSDILVLANGPGIHRNFQVSVSEYANYQILPKAAKALEYLEMIDFKAPSFATNVKRGFCYQIMDDIDGLSFEIRSLAWMPSEIIVKIARCSSSLNVIRLRNTCSEIRGALSSTNAQFWKGMIKKYESNLKPHV